MQDNLLPKIQTKEMNSKSDVPNMLSHQWLYFSAW